MPEQKNSSMADEQETKMGSGRGNAISIAGLKPGELVIDLGSGRGSDCFLAAQEVGGGGQVIGVDRSPDKIAQAQAEAEKGNHVNVEFRVGEIERLPIANEMADVIISNGVINLSVNKPQVFREAYRVLKFGGRLAIADVVATAELPEAVRNDERLVAAGMTNADHIDDLAAMLEEAGFDAVKIESKGQSCDLIRDCVPGGLEEYLGSATIEAIKPFV